jgi:hypothetical protein
MAWTDSRIFRAFTVDTLAGTAVFDLDSPSDTYKVALYNNTPTPDKDATSALSAYNAGSSAWVTANEQTSGADWPAAGKSLAGMTVTAAASGVAMFDATDLASGSAATLANVYGCLVYDDTKTTPVADQGVCFLYFGGSNAVTAGTLTLVFNANGLFRISV